MYASNNNITQWRVLFSCFSFSGRPLVRQAPVATPVLLFPPLSVIMLACNNRGFCVMFQACTNTNKPSPLIIGVKLDASALYFFIGVSTSTAWYSIIFLVRRGEDLHDVLMFPPFWPAIVFRDTLWSSVCEQRDLSVTDDVVVWGEPTLFFLKVFWRFFVTIREEQHT